METFVLWVIAALVVGLIVFGIVAAVTGRGEPMADVAPDARPDGLPVDRMATAEEIGGAQFDLAFRGYRMAEVDAVLERLAHEVDARDLEIARLRRSAARPDGERAEETAARESEPGRHG